MPEDRELKATLRFDVDKASVNRTRQAAAGAGKQIESEAEKVAKRLREQAEAVAKAAEEQARRVAQKMQLVRDAADIGGEIAEGFVAAGAAISGPLLLSLNSYLQNANKLDPVARQWRVQTERIAEAQRRVGGEVAQQILPLLEKAADLAERASDFAERNPDVIRAALSVGTATATLGAIGVAVSKGVRIYADAKQLASELLAAKLQDQAANKQLTAAGLQGKAAIGRGVAGAGGAAAAAGGGLTTAGVAGALGTGLGIAAGGVLAGGFAYEGLAKSRVGQRLGLQQGTTGQLLSLGALGLGELFGGRGEQWFKAVARFTGQLDETADVAEQAADNLGAMQDAIGPDTWRMAVDAYTQFQEEQVAAQEQYERDRQATVEQYGQRRVEAEERYEERRSDAVEQYGRQRAREAASFARSEARAAERYNDQRIGAIQDFARQQAEEESAYYERRIRRARDYGIETARMEEDHQRSMRRLQEDAQLEMEDAAVRRDATALVRAMRDYNRQRSRAEEDYQVQARRRSEDFARAMADEEEAFQAQRAQRQAEFDLRLQEAQEQYDAERDQRREDYDLRRAEAEEDFAQRLADMDENYQEEQARIDAGQQQALANLDQQHRDEQARRENAFRQQLSDLDSALTGETETRRAYYELMEADLVDWLSRMRQTTAAASAPSYSYSPGGRGAATGEQGYAGGGYVRGTGAAMVHAGEFVLNPQTTRRLEREMGGLTQANVGGSRVQINAQANFAAGFQGDRAMIAQMLDRWEQQIYRNIGEAMGQGERL